MTFLFAVATGLAANSQSVYQFRYKFSTENDSVTYRSVFIRQYDGSGIFRIKYKDPATRQEMLVEMNAEELELYDTNGIIDSSRILFKTTKQRKTRQCGRTVYCGRTLYL